MYDHDMAFLDDGYMDWRQTRIFAIGDVVFIYCTRPYCRVMYKTIVISIQSQPPNEKYWRTKQKIPENARYMRLSLVKRVDSDELSLGKLQEHGLRYAPQSPCLAKGEVLSYLNDRFGE